MKRAILGLALVLVLSNPALGAATVYPKGPVKAALEFPHFPDRLHTFVFRNWGLVEPERLAKVLGTDVKNVRAVAVSMGLADAPAVPPEMLSRGYITLIRRNWHLLPYEQIEELLALSAERLAHLLREDDFLWVKLGNLKPQVGRLAWAEPDAKARARAAEIAAVVREELAAAKAVKEEPRFAFLKRFQEPLKEDEFPKEAKDPLAQAPRYCHSYFAVFGDPLLDAHLDPYPDRLLKELAELGVTGVWLHVVLRDLAPGGPNFPEFGRDHEKRLANLTKLVARARRFGIGVYLYMNEPRAMPESFFANRKDLAGVRENDFLAMCTSRPEVRDWMSAALAHVFKAVPDTAGVFTISGSENLTSCASHHNPGGCPRCAKRDPAEIIAEANATVAAGVRAGSPEARVIVWDWGWPDAWAPGIIEKLPQDVWLQSVSEWSLPIERGGVRSAVGEYSLSAVGPGPRATKHWALARQRGMKTIAKCQFNVTWEIASVPSLPVMDLVARHCKNLSTAGVDGYMLGWSLGGYPSANLDVARRFNQRPEATVDEILDAVAKDRFGEAGAKHAREAWTHFSRAFEQYPFHGNVIYRCPVQMGPANLLYEKPTGYASTMVGIPYDDAKGWSNPYPPEVLAKQFEAIADRWEPGVGALRRAVDAEAGELRFARAAGLHFRSVANQTRFAVAKDPAERRRLSDQELVLARELLGLCLADSRLGFEASNHYFYVPQDLIEKIINCRYMESRFP